MLSGRAGPGRRLQQVVLGPAGAGATQAPGEARAGERKQAVKLQLNWVPEPELGGFCAAASAGEVIRARLQGAGIVAVYAVYRNSPQALMVHAGSGVSSLEEIFTSGKIARVAMEAGLPYGRFLEQRYGFDQVSVVQYSGNSTTFLQDPGMAQQCFVFSEPVSAREQDVPVEVFSIAESGFTPYLAVVITSAAVLEEQAEVVAEGPLPGRDRAGAGDDLVSLP